MDNYGYDLVRLQHKGDKWLSFFYRFQIILLLCLINATCCLAQSYAPVKNQTHLKELKDLHLPDPVGWWPMAPGWYIVTGMIVAICLIVFLMWRQKILQSRPKKAALNKLASYQQAYQNNHHVQMAAARVAEILKRVALVYFPRQEVASLQGEQWIEFLNQTGRGLDFHKVRTMLLIYPFRNPHDQECPDEMGLLFSLAKQWISQRRKPCSN